MSKIETGKCYVLKKTVIITGNLTVLPLGTIWKIIKISNDMDKTYISYINLHGETSAMEIDSFSAVESLQKLSDEVGSNYSLSDIVVI